MAQLYGLFLNMMRGNHEQVDLVAVADNRAKLQAWADSQRAEAEYQDGTTSAFGGILTKTYRQRSRLEYYNPPANWDVQGENQAALYGGVAEIPSREEWIKQGAEAAMQQWDRAVALKMI